MRPTCIIRNSTPGSESHRPFRPSERLEAFSDGVFAIVITLLVIELALPHLHDPRSSRELFDGLWSIRSRLASYFICFLFVGQLWVAHSNFFRLVAKTDNVLFWLNLLLLMFVCLQPFVTTILGEYPQNPGSVFVFGILFVATGATFGPMSWYCGMRHLYHPDIDPVGLRRGLRLISIIDIASIIPLAFAMRSPSFAMFCYLALIVGYIVVQSQFRIRVPSQEE